MIRPSDIRLLDVGGTFIKCGDGRCIPVASGGSREEIAAALQQAVAAFEGALPPYPLTSQGSVRYPRGSRPTDIAFGSVPASAGRSEERLSNPTHPLLRPSNNAPLPIIAVAIPGPFDYEKGIFLMRHKFAAVYGESFRALAGLPADIDIYYCHDVVAALEGCLATGQPGGIALVTIGTGLGFAHTQGGTVQLGPTGSPARPLYNVPWGEGILEDVVSARGIRAVYARLSGRTDLSAAQIATLAQNGDEAALQTFSDLGAALGEALAPVLEELGVGTLLLAGQVCRSLNLFERPLRNALEGIEVRPAPAGAVFAGLERLVRAAHPHLDE